jgi:hypothetical protein
MLRYIYINTDTAPTAMAQKNKSKTNKRKENHSHAVSGKYTQHTTTAHTPPGTYGNILKFSFPLN